MEAPFRSAFRSAESAYEKAISLLPPALAYRAALIRSDIGYRFLGGRRSHERENIIDSLELVFGDGWTPGGFDRVARDYFRVRSCAQVDMRLSGGGKALLGLAEVRGREHLEAALQGGKGAIIASAHFDSPWSCFSLIGGLGFPITVVARWSWKPDARLKRNLPYVYLHRPNILRNSLGSAVQIANVLKSNEFVGMLIDADVAEDDPSTPMTFDFLGGKVALAPGATTIARLTGSPVIVVMLHRTEDWRHQVLEIFPPVTAGSDPVAAFARCLVPIEERIRRYPAQWDKLPAAGKMIRPMEAFLRLARRTSGFRRFEDPQKEDSLRRLAEFFDTFEISAAYRSLLLLLKGETIDAEWKGARETLESYVARRAVCNLAATNYNRVFSGLARIVQKGNTTSGEIRGYFASLAGGSSVWPDDEAFSSAWQTAPICSVISSDRIAYILRRVNETYQAEGTDTGPVGDLAIEHIMPSQWHAAWPLPDGSRGLTPQELVENKVGGPAADASRERDSLIHTFGNLTLVAQPLDTTISNSGWETKKPEILKSSRLQINLQLQSYDAWDEDAIRLRGRELFERARGVWPGPAPHPGLGVTRS